MEDEEKHPFVIPGEDPKSSLACHRELIPMRSDPGVVIANRHPCEAISKFKSLNAELCRERPAGRPHGSQSSAKKIKS